MIISDVSMNRGQERVKRDDRKAVALYRSPSCAVHDAECKVTNQIQLLSFTSSGVFLFTELSHHILYKNKPYIVTFYTVAPLYTNTHRLHTYSQRAWLQGSTI